MAQAIVKTKTPSCVFVRATRLHKGLASLAAVSPANWEGGRIIIRKYGPPNETEYLHSTHIPLRRQGVVQTQT